MGPPTGSTALLLFRFAPQTRILLYFYILYFYFEHNKMFHSYRTKSLL